MKKSKVSFKASIINRLIAFTLVLAAITLLALSVSARIANDTQGSAYMVNQLGLLRMKSYQLLSMIPLKQEDYFWLDLYADVPITHKYTQLLERYALIDELNALKTEWDNKITPQIKTANNIQNIRPIIEDYVSKIDQLVYAIDNKTEDQITLIAHLQIAFIVVIVTFLTLQFYYLRRYLFTPWKKLLTLIETISTQNFSERFVLRQKKDEFDLLGQAFNHMSEQIELHYHQLEQHVQEKTAQLQSKNEILSFLYQATKQLYTSNSLCERFLPVLHKLEALTPLSQFQIQLYESDEQPNFSDHSPNLNDSNVKSIAFCQNPICTACTTSINPLLKNTTTRHWYLQDEQQKYGFILAQIPKGKQLSQEQEDLITTLVEQMTLAITLDKQLEQQKHYLLMNERSAMARELHDSIAQSLSSLKIYTSCLQMQTDIANHESAELIATMRKEINNAYSQLRELITSFRLQVNQVGFYASLQDLITEFDAKLKLQIDFSYQLPHNVIDSRYTIHVLQIIRESLNNIYKHAKANQVKISLSIDDNQVILVKIEDNGVGILKSKQQEHHYGLIMMRDRAELINGNLFIKTEPYKGTRIMLTFKPSSNCSLKAVNR
ncbi:nitrate/nitrite two-component system sensor histidine kinase NarX [Orbaceae bacterium ac157xtp]